MAGNKKQMIAFNYFGGKFSIVSSIYKLFPEHNHFVDLFCGSMVVTLNKKPSRVETANDINGDVVNFFKVLREFPNELITMIYLTPNSRDEFNNSWNTAGISDLERARRFYVRMRQGYFGLGAQLKNKAWHFTYLNSRTIITETVSKWINGLDKLLPVIDRIKSIQIENRDFRELIKLVDHKTTFFYCDPPYMLESRNTHADYVFPFTNNDHIELSEILHQIRGKAMISGYKCKSMDELYYDWEMIELGNFNTISGKKRKECVWINYKTEVGQQKLFE